MTNELSLLFSCSCAHHLLEEVGIAVFTHIQKPADVQILHTAHTHSHIIIIIIVIIIIRNAGYVRHLCVCLVTIINTYNVCV